MRPLWFAYRARYRIIRARVATEGMEQRGEHMTVIGMATATGPETLARRTVGEWTLRTATPYREPFTDVTVDAVFTGPEGTRVSVPGFYDGDGTWRVRFNPGVAGEWQYAITSRPANAELHATGVVTVTEREARGFLRATPGEAWGFAWEDGTPALIFGDTVYNLFGFAHCGADVVPFLERRAAQGFNLLRVRVPVSPFHPPDGYNQWQTRRTWAWGGSEQSPRFDRFDLDYFATVDRVVQAAEATGIGLEIIMEAWGFEWPFNSRAWFTAEWEELWLRYLVARYDAYTATLFWTPMNEYEYYPNGDWNYTPVANRWMMRIGRWLKATAGHGHLIAVHNGPRLPPFAERFAADPEAVDAVLYQEWGTRDREDGWLAAGIEEKIAAAFAGWERSAVFAEWGYEREPAYAPLLPSHEHCDPDHTRRGAWRGAMTGLGIIHGFEHTWGPWMDLDTDQPGLQFLLHWRRFFTEIAPFALLHPAPALLAPPTTPYLEGHAPHALASADVGTVVVYLPVGGAITLALPDATERPARWFDPRTGDLYDASPTDETNQFVAPAPTNPDRPDDWVLILTGAAVG